MEHLLNEPESQVEKRKLTMLRKRASAILRNELREHRLSPGEKQFLAELCDQFSNKMPWAWVQRGTQEEWAYDFAMPVSTFKRTLKRLRERNIILGGMGSLPYRPKWAEGIEYPIWILNPVLIEQVANAGNMKYWNVDSEHLARFASLLSQDETYGGSFWSAVKSHWGTYSLASAEIPKPVIKTQSLDIAQESADCPCVVDTRTIYVVNSRSNPLTTVGRRLRRRRTEDRRTMPVLGEDPDPEPEPEKSDLSPVEEVESHFQKQWTAAAFKTPGLPPVPWAGNRNAFRGWVKKTLLPDQNHDIQLIKDMITQFCEDPITPTAVDPWKVFARKQTRYRHKVIEARKRKQESEELAELKQEQAEHRKARRERMERKKAEAKKRAPKVKPVSEFDLLTKEDLND